MTHDTGRPNERNARHLPDLAHLVTFDDRLREVPRDPRVLSEAAARAADLIDEARMAGDDAGMLRLLGYLGNACRVLGRHDEAVAALEEAVRLAETRADARAATANALRLGEARKYRGEFAAAEALFRATLERIRAAGGDLAVYEDVALQHFGKCLLDQGRYAEAVAMLEQALVLRRAKGDPALLDSTERALALALARRGEDAGRH